jgi:putative copper export protein
MSSPALQVLHQVLIILHIIFAAAWFGLGLRLSSQARTALALDNAAAGQAIVDDGADTVKYMNLFIVLSLVFAYAVLGTGITLERLGLAWPYHASSTLILVIAALQFFLVRPGWASLREHLGADFEAANGARKRVAMGTGLGHATWFAILVLMFWKYIAPWV